MMKKREKIEGKREKKKAERVYFSL